jgi:hypothetical protein
MLGDNLRSLQSTSNPGAICKKKHSMVNFHYVRESCAAGIIQLAKVDTSLNLSDSFTKPVDTSTFINHRHIHYSTTPGEDKEKAKIKTTKNKKQRKSPA